MNKLDDIFKRQRLDDTIMYGFSKLIYNTWSCQTNAPDNTYQLKSDRWVR